MKIVVTMQRQAVGYPNTTCRVVYYRMETTD